MMNELHADCYMSRDDQTAMHVLVKRAAKRRYYKLETDSYLG